MVSKVIVIASACMLAVHLQVVAFSAALVWSQVQAQSERGIAYLSGGIGLEEREALRATAKAYDLMLSFAERAGHYLSDVQVVIHDASGNAVLEAVSQGPWFLVQLPPGKYTILATTLGSTQRQTAQVTAGRQTQLHFYW